MTKTCTKCGTEKDVKFFNKKGPTKLQSYCRECSNRIKREWYNSNLDRERKKLYNRRSKYRDDLRNEVWNFLKEHPCSICGENDPIVLEFHHIEDKKYNISNIIQQSSSLRLLRSEISKCEVLCANCHKRKTFEERNWWKSNYMK